jgi:hypothetical protein
MFHHVFNSVLSTVFDLAFATLPAAPLFAVKKLPPLAVKNSRSGYRLGLNNGGQQKLSR